MPCVSFCVPCSFLAVPVLKKKDGGGDVNFYFVGVIVCGIDVVWETLSHPCEVDIDYDNSTIIRKIRIISSILRHWHIT